MAEDLGKMLLGKIEEVGLDEILHTLRLKEDEPTLHFNFEPLDALLRTLEESRQRMVKKRMSPILELMSLAPGSGETDILNHLCAQATLPKHLDGNQACVVVLDLDGSFSVPQLAKQIELCFQRRKPQDVEAAMDEAKTKDVILDALQHVHIFHPQSLASTIATLDSLLEYLFDQTCHHSFDRPVAFVALHACSAFYWQDRLDVEDAAFLAITSTSSNKAAAQLSGYVDLSASLNTIIGELRCPAVITTWHLSRIPHPPNERALRPALPVIQPTLRLAMRRLPVRKFPANISLEEALRQVDDRRKAVDEGKFECFVNEWNMDERTLRALQKVGGGFAFRVTKEGLSVAT